MQSLAQLKSEIDKLKTAVTPDNLLENIIIYDAEKGIPEFNDDKTRIFIPEDGRD